MRLPVKLRFCSSHFVMGPSKGDEQMTHTPIPWKLDAKPTDYPQAVASDDGTIVALTGTDRANADFIVRAVNNHAALLAALEEINEAMIPTVVGDNELSMIARRARAAIKAAKGE